MAQLQKSLPSLILVLLSSSSFTYAGFVSPGNSIYVGTSPTLRYLLACGHLATKPPYLSTHDIYTIDQVFVSVFVFVFSPAPVFVFTTEKPGGKGAAEPAGRLGSATDRSGGRAGEKGDQEGQVHQQLTKVNQDCSAQNCANLKSLR